MFHVKRHMFMPKRKKAFSQWICVCSCLGLELWSCCFVQCSCYSYHSDNHWPFSSPSCPANFPIFIFFALCDLGTFLRGIVKQIDTAWVGQGHQGKEAASLERLVFYSDWANQSPNMHILLQVSYMFIREDLQTIGYIRMKIRSSRITTLLVTLWF